MEKWSRAMRRKGQSSRAFEASVLSSPPRKHHPLKVEKQRGTLSTNRDRDTPFYRPPNLKTVS